MATVLVGWPGRNPTIGGVHHAVVANAARTATVLLASATDHAAHRTGTDLSTPWGKPTVRPRLENAGHESDDGAERKRREIPIGRPLVCSVRTRPSARSARLAKFNDRANYRSGATFLIACYGRADHRSSMRPSTFEGQAATILGG